MSILFDYPVYRYGVLCVGLKNESHEAARKLALEMEKDTSFFTTAIKTNIGHLNGYRIKQTEAKHKIIDIEGIRIESPLFYVEFKGSDNFQIYIHTVIHDCYMFAAESNKGLVTPFVNEDKWRTGNE